MTDTTPTELSPTDPDASESWADHGEVRADRVEIKQGSAANVEAGTVSIEQGGAARVNAQELSVTMGGVAVARTESLQMGQGSSAFAVATDQAELSEGSNVFMLIARNASGNIRPILDWRSAAAFGAGLGLVLRVLRRR